MRKSSEKKIRLKMKVSNPHSESDERRRRAASKKVAIRLATVRRCDSSGS